MSLLLFFSSGGAPPLPPAEVPTGTAVLTTAAKAALDAGGIPLSVFELDLPDGTAFRISDRGVASQDLLYKPFVRRWSPITYGTSDTDGRVERIRASVEVIDPEPRILTKILKGATGRNLRGSAARIWGLIPGLPAADWWRRFTGIAIRAEMREPYIWSFELRADLEELRGDAHRLTVTRDDFPTAPDDSISQIVPVVYGVQDSTGIDVNGMLSCIRCSTTGDFYNSTRPYRYLVTEGFLPDVITSWADGGSETALGNRDVDWFWTNRKGHLYTELGFDSDPGEATAITVDAYGLANVATPTPDPSDTSQVIENPIEILRHYLTNFVFNHWNDGTVNSSWFTPFVDSPLEQESWDFAQAYFAKKAAVAARSMPAQSVEQTMMEAAESFEIGFFLQQEGKLGLAFSDPHTAKDAVYGQVVLRPSDMRKPSELIPDAEQAITRVRYRFFLAESTGRYLASRTSADPHRSINREVELTMPWSGATEPSF